jgi:hypothetical protein
VAQANGPSRVLDPSGVRDPAGAACEDAPPRGPDGPDGSDDARDVVHEHARALPDGTFLVRVSATDRAWARTLPRVPDGRTVTVTVGQADLAPVPADDLVASGYRIVGVASDRRPLGRLVDLCVPPDLREANPRWWAELVTRADRIFDPRLGPVARVLAAELALHRGAAVSG